jgi:hypothetical protein
MIKILANIGIFIVGLGIGYYGVMGLGVLFG